MNKTILYAPLSYWEATPEEKAKVCNGCGAKGGIKVPNTFYGLCIKEACNIHDWMYDKGQTLADKLFADAMFRMNMTSIIDTQSNSLMAILRHSRAAKYYIAVVEWGDNAYWINRVYNEEKHITFTGEFR
ncbi:MAG: hypothetical protein AB7D96_10690 [Arcobacteraceae bacterium]